MHKTIDGSKLSEPKLLKEGSEAMRIQGIFEEFKKELEKLYGARLKQVILYG
ncbi:MAG: hypothetical protein ACP5E9_00310 [Candidatus Methanospirareceae archaeon]